MDLKLGLGLPSSPSQEVDLNSRDMEPKELQLSLNSMDRQGSAFCGLNGHDHFESSSTNNNTKNKKRGFAQAFGYEQPFRTVPKTLRLLHWENQSNDDDDRGHFDNKGCSSATSNFDGGARFNINSSYVKVHMEGVGIARKVNLNRYHSYQMLGQTLIAMFSTFKRITCRYKLIYQDVEGDWLLAADIPWRCFVQSVKRLKLIRSRVYEVPRLLTPIGP